jgi:hypothetical protein
MIVDPDQEYRIQYKEGWSRPSGLASFGTKVVPSLNGVDLSFMNSIDLCCWILLVKPSGSNILHDKNKLECLSLPNNYRLQRRRRAGVYSTRKPLKGAKLG